MPPFRSRLALAVLGMTLGATGCYQSHLGTTESTDAAVRCGDRACTLGEQCCVDCDGRPRCISLDLPCPPRDCAGACTSNLGCPADQYCRVPPGRCDAMGRCEPRPRGCPADCPGVCGCDASFYCNECVAAAAGMNLGDPSRCVATTCGDFGVCSPGETCCPLCAGAGLCVPADTMCPLVECPDECFSPAECAFGQTCQFPAGACTGPGRCVPFPDGCDDDCPGVCGCDGRTYCNECYALTAGVSVAHASSCERCGRGGGVCTEDEYCDLGPSCGALDGEACRPRPSDCPAIEDPVCGCDGSTYSNECFAASRGVTVRSRGPC